MTELCVATWNIGSLYADYDTAYPLLRQVISQYRPGVLCMQEMPMQQSLIDDICKWGNYSFTVTKTTSESHINKGKDMGIAVFSQYPLGEPTLLPLEKPDREIFYKEKQEYWHDKWFLSVPLFPEHGSPVSQIQVITGHGFPFHRYGLEKPEETNLIAPSLARVDRWVSETLQQTPAIPVLIAADFNITDPTAYMPRCRQCMTDVFRHQFTRPFGRKTDAIFLPRNAVVTNTMNWISPQRDGSYLFDHNFIAAYWAL